MIVSFFYANCPKLDPEIRQKTRLGDTLLTRVLINLSSMPRQTYIDKWEYRAYKKS